MKRGLTLIELLLALSLLSAVMVAGAEMIATAARVQSAVITPLQWEAAAGAALQLIHDDILTGDFAAESQPRRRKTEPAVQILEGKLHILTRSPAQGEARHVFRLDSRTSTLRLMIDGKAKHNMATPLLDHIKTFECELNRERSLLTVTLSSTDGQHVSRRYRTP